MKVGGLVRVPEAALQRSIEEGGDRPPLDDENKVREAILRHDFSEVVVGN